MTLLLVSHQAHFDKKFFFADKVILISKPVLFRSKELVDFCPDQKTISTLEILPIWIHHQLSSMSRTLLGA
jgi:hypothetical protein